MPLNNKHVQILNLFYILYNGEDKINDNNNILLLTKEQYSMIVQPKNCQHQIEMKIKWSAIRLCVCVCVYISAYHDLFGSHFGVSFLFSTTFFFPSPHTIFPQEDNGHDL